MKYYIFFIVFVLLACSENQSNNQIVNTVSNENTIEELNLSSLLRSGYEVSILEGIYDKLEESRPDLKNLNDKMKELSNFNENFLDEHSTYEEKSSIYYNNADLLVNSIQDSILRTQMMDILNLSKSNYSKNHSNLDMQISNFNSQKLKIEDMYKSIKLINTLPLIEEYQRKNMEIHEKNYKEMIEKQSKIIKDLENSLIKK